MRGRGGDSCANVCCPGVLDPYIYTNMHMCASVVCANVIFACYQETPPEPTVLHDSEQKARE